MKNATKWNTELALELESLFYKDSVPEEWIEIIDKLERRWQGIANLIGFDYTDEDVVKKIEDFFPVTDEKSPLHIFDDAEEAIDFFQDMRTIKARRAWFVIRTTKETYSPSVQALIKICCEIIDRGPVALRHKSYGVFENIIFCVSAAIGNNDVTYNSLCLLCTVIQNLDKFQIDWAMRFSENVRGSKIAQGKQEKVEIRKAYFYEFEEYFEDLKSDIADFKNAGSRYGGTSAAALFLKKFLSQTVEEAKSRVQFSDNPETPVQQQKN